MKSNISFYTLSKTGPKHIKNQDSIIAYYNKFKHQGFLLVCDGVGGYVGGEIASSIATKTVYKSFKKKDSKQSWNDWLMNTLKLIKKLYIQKIAKNNSLKEMSSTLCLAIIDHNKLYVANIGDSMCYVYNSINKISLTQPQTFYNYLLRTNNEIKINNGEYNEEVLVSLVNFISAYNPKDIWFDFSCYELKNNDIVVVCSDGIYKYLDLDYLKFKNCNPKQICDMFYKNVLSNNTNDDASVGVFKYVEIK